jgi:hypothetical protein
MATACHRLGGNCQKGAAAERINPAVLKMPIDRANGVSLETDLPAGGPPSRYPITQKFARIIVFIVRLRRA